jgi:hypothetical protein
MEKFSELLALAIMSLLVFACTTGDEPVASLSAGQIFSSHDPEGRFSNTIMSKVGTIVSERRRYEIYELKFVNPVSRHGQQRVAIIQNSNFIGSYQTNGAKIIIEKGGLGFHDQWEYPAGRINKSEDFLPVTDGKFPKETLINGYVVPLEPNI